MASSILNSDDGVVSGTSGLKSTGGDDGVLVFQSKGVETARINTDKQIVAAAGTNSLPALTTTGDLNTGIFFPAADQVAIATNGVEAIRINSSQTVTLTNALPVASGGTGVTTSTGSTSVVLSTSPSITTPRVITAINDTNGNELFGVTATGSAVNEFTVANAATGNAPTLSATGSDTNIDINITPKGTGEVNLSKVDIDGGTIDGTTIGANSAAAGTFTDVTLNAQGDLRFADSDSSNWVAFQAPATVASNVTWTLPAADGTTGQVLTTNGSGTLSWSSVGIAVDFLLIAGGGGGGIANVIGNGTGGGGAGGYRTSAGTSGGGASAENALTLQTGVNYTLTVGAGGAGGTKGSNSVFSAITSEGGGGGSVEPGGNVGGNGGSGGGASRDIPGGGRGQGTAGQGFNGGAGGPESSPFVGGGGGGAGAVGQDAPSASIAGNGGTGVASSITGSSVTRAGGGGGGTYNGGTKGTGGSGGGGNGGQYQSPAITGGSGTVNTGGGGGAGNAAGTGGSGVVILKYPDVYTISNPGGGLTSSTSTSGNFKITTFTAGTGNIQFS